MAVVVPLLLVLIPSVGFWVYFGYNPVTWGLKVGMRRAFTGRAGLVIL